MKVETFAPAKINLTLHVTGRRADGYHLLDSLVVFADVGDWIGAAASADLTLAVEGPFADGTPTDDSNSVMKAASLIGATAALSLTKNIPVAAGLGGGSSDAAATLFALAELNGTPVPRDQALTLGADVPVCMRATRTRMRGIGELLNPAPHIPKLFAVLANPGVALETAAVFGALAQSDNTPMPEEIADFETVESVADWLSGQRNDLEPPAIALQPVIGDVLAALRDSEGCLFARMSGSGATCFGLYPDRDAASRAASAISAAQPGWWVVPTLLS